jgi:ATP-binding cassette, subfamily B, bacterial MsbA
MEKNTEKKAEQNLKNKPEKKSENKVINKPKYSNIKTILPYIKPYWFRATVAALLSIPVGSMDAFIAMALKPYMDVVLIEKSVSNTTYIPIMIVVFALLQGFLIYSISYLNTWVGSKITNDVKSSLFSKLMTFDAGFFDKSTSGEVLFRFNNDVDLACNGLLTNARQFLTRIVSTVSLIVVLFYNSWQLAIISVVVLVLALFPLTLVRKKLRELMGRTVKSGSAVVTHYNEAFSGNRIVSSYNLSDYLSQKFKKSLDSVFSINIKMVQRTGIISPLMHFIVSLGIGGVIWMGSYLIVNNEITPGNFVSFLAALLMLYTPVKSIGNNYNSIQMSMLAIERINQILKRVPLIINKENPIQLDKIKNEIVYKNVGFKYNPDRDVLKNINIKVKVGETVALVGNSGGGKTTFVNLLPRFYDVNEGSISIDGVDIRDIDLKSLRENIAIVFQDNFLFAGTFRENIVLNSPNVTEDAIHKALKDACLYEFVMSLEKGLDTEVGERGILLSGGQKQRLAIARAFLKDAAIVILDEATSALDNKSEAVVQQAIENLMKDRTVFIIAHRLSTVQNADRILVINDGEVVEEGSHKELLGLSESIYSSLYYTQLKV